MGKQLTVWQRSISVKLALAFLFVGVLGAALVALYVGLRTRTAFERFRLDQELVPLVGALKAHYQERESWTGAGPLLRRSNDVAMGRGMMHGWTLRTSLVDTDGIILQDTIPRQIGEQVSRTELRRAVALEHDGVVVGYLLVEGIHGQPRQETLEAAFLSRVRNAILLSALTAAGVALLVGGLLTRTLMGPIHALTTATRAVADGDLGHQVVVSSQDELGELARSFNQMIGDLAHTAQLRRQMTADIAHDLRTPLSVLMGYTEALNDGKLKGSAEIYTVMHCEAQHLNHLVGDLRLLSLADAGELQLSCQALSPESLLEQVEAAHRVQAEASGISLVVDAPSDLPSISADPERMTQVLNNLVTNAMRYTPSGGTIRLRAQAAATAVHIDIADNGSGIAPEDLPYVFERFYRGDRSRQQWQGESGLGLTIVKSLVEAQGGSVAVNSSPGAGACFTISLPIA